MLSEAKRPPGAAEYNKSGLGEPGLFNHTVRGIPLASFANPLTKINHFNLIRLSGVCFTDGTWYLVFEYASNGPLSDWIYNNNINIVTISIINMFINHQIMV